MCLCRYFYAQDFYHFYAFFPTMTIKTSIHCAPCVVLRVEAALVTSGSLVPGPGPDAEVCGVWDQSAAAPPARRPHSRQKWELLLSQRRGEGRRRRRARRCWAQVATPKPKYIVQAGSGGDARTTLSWAEPLCFGQPFVGRRRP